MKFRFYFKTMPWKMILLPDFGAAAEIYYTLIVSIAGAIIATIMLAGWPLIIIWKFICRAYKVYSASNERIQEVWDKHYEGKKL